MRVLTTLALMLGLAAFITGCGNENAAPAPEAEDPTASSDASHGHEGGHDDDGHHGGPSHVIGNEQVGPYTVEVTQIGDHVDAGEPVTFEIVITGDADDPEAVRAWVGNEQAIGSVKGRAVDRDEFWDADLQSPDQMPEDSRFWVEIQTSDGERHTQGFDLHGG